MVYASFSWLQECRSLNKSYGIQLHKDHFPKTDKRITLPTLIWPIFDASNSVPLIFHEPGLLWQGRCPYFRDSLIFRPLIWSLRWKSFFCI
jgi:hypothetical protein